MKPYAELLEFNQPNPIRLPGFTRIRDSFSGLAGPIGWWGGADPEIDRPKLYDPERIMEFAGRGDYGESYQRKLGETAKVRRTNKTEMIAGNLELGIEEIQVPILQKYIDMNHQSMIEFGWATFYMEFSRVVLAELTRHRLASYQVESQRFVKYGDVPDINDLFYFPDGIDARSKDILEESYACAFDVYQELRVRSVAPQDARYVLPNAFKTRMCMAANVREWRHIINLRLDKSAQPEMRELMQHVYDQLVVVFPNALYGVNEGRGTR